MDLKRLERLAEHLWIDARSGLDCEPPAQEDAAALRDALHWMREAHGLLSYAVFSFLPDAKQRNSLVREYEEGKYAR
jgi:hypothetical protein